MANIERYFHDMDPRSWTTHGKMSRAIMLRAVIKEWWMLQQFGIPLEPIIEPGDCLIPEGSKLIPMTQELLQFSNN